MIFTYKENELAKIQMYHEESAKAYIRGGEKNPNLFAEALFYQLPNGVLVVISAENLPQTETGFFAFHLHNALIINDNPDDFKTQPSGNAGEKIACGIIVKA